jgi:hypothetical protein
MLDVKEVYDATVSRWRSREQLELASLILNGIAHKQQDQVIQANEMPRRSMREILDELPGGRIFKTSEDVDGYLREERDSWER